MPDRPFLPPSMTQPKNRMTWRPVSVTHAGKQWNASWEVKDGEIHVFGAYGEERLPLRGREPDQLAEAMLLKLVKAWLGR